MVLSSAEPAHPKKTPLPLDLIFEHVKNPVPARFGGATPIFAVPTQQGQFDGIFHCPADRDGG